MKKAFSFIIKQTVAIILIVAMVIGFGVYSTINMPINLLPDINVPMVCIQVIYPGANAQSVEKDVTVELEEGLSSITGVTDVSSYSYDNLSALVLSFNYGTDTNEKKSAINSKLNSINLPDGVTTSVYDIDLNAEALAVLSVTADDLSKAHKEAKGLADKIKALDGVENVEIKGGAETSYVLKPFGGLELISPLIVQQFSYGALDIPLGNVTLNGADVQIRNNTDVTKEEEIYNMPLTLPSAIVTLLSSVKRITTYYQNCKEGDLEKLKEDMGNGVLAVLRQIDELSSAEMSDFASLKTYMNIAATYTAEQLKNFKASRYYDEIYKQVTNDPEEEGGERTPKTDEEIEDLVDDMKSAYPAFSDYITADMLKVVRDGKLDPIIAYRAEYLEQTVEYKKARAENRYYAPTEDDYFLLETLYVNVYGGEGGLYAAGGQLAAIREGLIAPEKQPEQAPEARAEGEPAEDNPAEENPAEDQPEEITGLDKYPVLADVAAVIGEGAKGKLYENIDFALKTSATGLTAIGNKKEDAEEAGETQPYHPTNTECAMLFTGTDLSSEHPIVTSPTFMAFVRADSYGDENGDGGNMDLLINFRNAIGFDERQITAAEYNDLYTALDLEGIFEFRLTEDLFSFILGKKASDLAGSSLVVSCSEIARITKEDEYTSYVYYANGELKPISGTIIEVYKSNGANSAAVVSAVKSTYGDYLSSGDGKFRVVLLDDQSQFISDSVSNVLISMLIGGVLAVAVIFLFLKKLRTSLIVAVTMPLSVLAALICLNLMGITLNMVSLGGLAVGIGMLVDNSIVVIESVSKHRDMGKTAFESAVDGTCEVGGALIGSTVTTVCVFIPIIFSGGLTGEIFTDLSWAVIFSLTFSLLVAVTVIPTLYSLFNGGKKQLLKGEKVKGSGEFIPPPEEAEIKAPSTEQQPNGECVTPEEHTDKPSEKPARKKLTFRERMRALGEPKIMNGITSFYGKILPKVLNKKLITVLVALCVFGASVGMLFITGTEFLPSIDKGQIEINMSYGSGVRLEAIQSDVYGFVTVLEDGIDVGGVHSEGLKNIDFISVSVGKNGMLALTDTGIITVQLTTNRGTDKVVEQIRSLAEAYRTKYHSDDQNWKKPVVREIDGVVASLMSGADDMSVTIIGKGGEGDSQTLKEIAEKISYRLETSGDGFVDVKTSATNTSTQYTLKFDRRKMEELNLDYQTTVLTLRIGIASYTACKVTIDGESYNVAVRFDDGAVTSLTTLEEFVVGAEADDGTQAVKLKDILKTVEDQNGNPVKILIEQKEACIRRQNGKQMITVSATIPGVDTGTAGKKLQKIAADVLKEYDGYSFEESGITGYLNDAFSGLVVALVISFALLYGVMAIQFSSAITPLIVMSSIPFSFTGGFLALVITGTRLNVVSFIGLIMLMGVVVNNAIVMLEKIKQLHESGMSHYQAVQKACKVRLRPIFMTTLTTILALIPLAVGIGQGSELMQPLGIVVMGGLLLGTLVTLVLVPTVYCAVYGISQKRPEGRRKKSNEQPAAENNQEQPTADITE